MICRQTLAALNRGIDTIFGKKIIDYELKAYKLKDVLTLAKAYNEISPND